MNQPDPTNSEGLARSQYGPCIFCRSTALQRPPVEHIIPESLGCPEHAILSCGEVCHNCNNRLSRVDSKLIDVLCVPRALFQDRTKKGRRPTLSTENIKVSWTDAGRHIDLHPGRPGPLQTLDASEVGTTGMVSFRIDLQGDIRLSRGLHKIGLESLALFEGGDRALAAELDAIRAFVLGETNAFRPFLVALEPDRDAPAALHSRIAPPYGNAEGFWISPVTLFSTSFLVGLGSDPDQILRIGRDLNDRAGRELFRTLDAGGTVRAL